MKSTYQNNMYLTIKVTNKQLLTKILYLTSFKWQKLRESGVRI